ncbi:glutaminase [Flavobacterium algicola]|uniref:glutaminase n=1 Tax=Flavobacterium algicola TaxID=556529 RepID=UPI001EFD4055|nr:glutaminase [Flavobacterium algicola]MCG9791575.1 glutaminase [Flavobacterium algicola]
MENIHSVLNGIYNKFADFEDKGQKATYIPELANVDENLFGVSLTTLNHGQINIGDAHQQFSVQSISKVLLLIMAYNVEGEKLWKRVDVEPSGAAFNSMILLELEKGIPRNPLINAGAIVIADIVFTHFKNPEDDFIKFVRRLTKDDSIDYDIKVFESEKSVGYRNYALINMMKSFGNITNTMDEVMDFYFKICSLSMNCAQLSKAFFFFANDGIDPFSKEVILTPGRNRRINAIMLLCGFYDEAGEFAYRVGLPGKSGVGGGILAILPNKYAVVVFSPKLNEKGNSYRGMAFLECLTTELSDSVF